LGASSAVAPTLAWAQGAQKKPNVVMLMQDDTGFSDFGVYLGGRALGHPTPNIDQLAKEGAIVHELVRPG
jgi:arylsulfatase A-like enzyme